MNHIPNVVGDQITLYPVNEKGYIGLEPMFPAWKAGVITATLIAHNVSNNILFNRTIFKDNCSTCFL